MTTILFLLLPVLLQAPAPPMAEPAVVPASAPAPAPGARPSASVEDLRARVHVMRMNLLFGGDKVKSAEREAIDFYNQRIEAVNRGIDSVHTDLAERRASYGVALDQALSGREGTAEAMEKAQVLRGEVAALERESAELSSTSGNLAKLVQAVQTRQRERETLATRMDASVGVDLGTTFTLGSVGLAPDVQVVRPGVSPFDDTKLVQDLIQRDPLAASRVLFGADPERYFRLFPLTPPSEALRKALDFPLPDLPGKR